MERKLQFTIKELQNCAQEHSNEQVGKVLKRLEIFGIENPYLKKAIKNILHESNRDFPKKLVAQILGFESFELELKRPQKEDTHNE